MSISMVRMISVVFLLLAGCGHGYDNEATQLNMNKPVKIAESGDTILWKVKDTTVGGPLYVYYTTPSGQVLR